MLDCQTYFYFYVANMIIENMELWKKIECFQIDEPNAAFPFSKKLAKENNWTGVFTNNAIAEYKKFIYLCCISSTGASPSLIVDEVWHLHLTYTQNYWEDFCRKTLQKQIHHNPSKGGTIENHKHTDWYNETLLMYEKVFGQKPPTEIWQQPGNKSIDINGYQALVQNKKSLLFAVGLLIIPFILCYLQFEKWDPYKLKGPAFIQFFTYLSAAIIAGLLLILFEGKKKLLLFVEENYPAKYSIYQAVYFLYGKHRALQTAIVDLLKKDILELSDDKTFINKSTLGNTSFYTNPLIDNLKQRAAGERLSYETIAGEILNESDFKHPAFDKFSLLNKQKNIWLWLIFLLGFILAVFRILQGLANDKPVTFLFFGIIILFILFLAIYKNLSNAAIIRSAVERKYSNEDLFNMQLKGHDFILRDFSKQGVTALSGFGEFAILSTMFAAYSPVSRFQNGNSDGGCSGSSRCSSCGGSSCGGSSCGGGGCGGGD